MLLARGQLFALLIRPALVGNLCQRLVAGEAEPVRCKSWDRQRQIARQCNASPDLIASRCQDIRDRLLWRPCPT